MCAVYTIYYIPSSTN